MSEEKRYGPWVVDTMMGEGTFAEVWHAHHADRPQQQAALKVLRSEWRHRTTFRDRFQDEATTMELLGSGAARIPALTSYFGTDCTAEIPWIAVEYIDGRPLDSILMDGMLPDGARLGHGGNERAEFATRVVRDTAEALAFAHRRGIVHRDVKPENILVSTSGRVVVIDFGIARDARARRHTGEDMPSPMTPDYAAPELLESRVTEHLENQLDVYALGCTLHELLGGRLPDISRTSAEGGRHSYLPRADSITAPPGTPDHLAVLVASMTEPQATDRPSLGQVITTLDSGSVPATLASRATAAVPPPPPLNPNAPRSTKGETLYPGRPTQWQQPPTDMPGADQSDTWAATTPGSRGTTWSATETPGDSGVAGLVAGILGTLALLAVAIAGGLAVLATTGTSTPAATGPQEAVSEQATADKPASASDARKTPVIPGFVKPPDQLPAHRDAPAWNRGRVEGASIAERDRARAAGEVIFDSTPPGLLVYVESKTLGRTPTSQRLMPGPYIVTFKSEYNRPIARVVAGGRNETVHVDLDKELLRTQLLITARATGGDGVLEVDGRSIGRPPALVDVEPGLHDVSWVPAGRAPVVRSVHVKDGDLRRVDL